jgi:D-alanine-D-alanine ligase
MTSTTKPAIAIITGGDVAERGISLASARTVYTHLDAAKYVKYVIELTGGRFIEQGSGAPVDLNDFSLSKQGSRIHFDLAYLMLHGHPAEDGRLQGYFELIGLPYTGCDVFSSALTFDKQATKDFLRSHDVPMAESRLLRKGQAHDTKELLKLGLPLFVKPNKNGSSYGVSKVKAADQLEAAIQLAFQYDDEVVAEAFLDGKEFSCGVLRRGGEALALPITEIVPFGEFFDYQAKYEKQSEEITPARLSESLTRKARELSRRVYLALGCRGACRVDYILVGDTFFLLEVNTIPGMSETSILPQQAIAQGWTIAELLDAVVEEALHSLGLG